MTGDRVPGPPTVRVILVEVILWWSQGHFRVPTPDPDLVAAFTPGQLRRLYDLVAKAEREVGQFHLEWVMEHLAEHGAAYLTADGQIVEANRPADAPDIPTPLLEAARSLYASAARLA